jgi:hypothetical protein
MCTSWRCCLNFGRLVTTLSFLRGKKSFDHSLGLAKELPVEVATNVVENMEKGAARCTICRVSK